MRNLTDMEIDFVSGSGALETAGSTIGSALGGAVGQQSGAVIGAEIGGAICSPLGRKRLLAAQWLDIFLAKNMEQ